MFVSKKKYKEAMEKIEELKMKLEKLVTTTKINNSLEAQVEQYENEISVNRKMIADISVEVSEKKTRMMNLDSNLKEKENHLLQLDIEIKSSTLKKTQLMNSIDDLIIEKNHKMSEMDCLNKEIAEAGINRFLEVTSLERKHLKQLTDDIKIQEQKACQGKKELEQMQKKLKNKEVIIEEYTKIKKSLLLAREEQRLQEVAYYKNVFPFTTTEKFKDELNKNISKQKELIKDRAAVNEGTTWTVNGSIHEGRRMTDLNIKAMLRSYNIECDNAISSLRYSNYSNVVERIDKSFATINRLNKKNELSICSEYHSLKLKELQLVYELKLFEEEEKEKLRILREEERERKRVEREIKDKLLTLTAREKEIEKEINRLNKEFTKSKGEKLELLDKIKELEDSLLLVNKKRDEVTHRQLVGKSGYVYIISNIGTLGENIYKIGMTRRLEPEERIKELSGASVPFAYDVHAMILTDDAPRLENHLHTVFNSKRVNLVNNRREFFNVSLDEIKREVFSVVGRDVVFIDSPDAKQYYQTLSLQKGGVNTLELEESLLRLH